MEVKVPVGILYVKCKVLLKLGRHFICEMEGLVEAWNRCWGSLPLKGFQGNTLKSV